MNGDNLAVLLSREKISKRVCELAEDISREYRDRRPLLLCVLKGAVIFLADLVRNLTLQVEIDFISASSYQGDCSKGEISFSPVSSSKFRGKDILIVEDIIDTGLTCQVLIDYLAGNEVASLKVCALLDKPSRRRKQFRGADFVGFTIPDKFVVGYGLDYEEKYRELNDICTIAK